MTDSYSSSRVSREARRAALAGAALALAAAVAAPLAVRAQDVSPAAAPRTLSLDEALRQAERVNEAVGIARAGVERARGEQYRARSEFFPQLSGSASYTRALRSEFQGIDFGPPDTRPECRVFVPPGAGATAAERLDSLEQGLALATDCQPTSDGLDLGNLPFGRANTWRLGLAASQTLFAGGRVVAQTRVAESGRRTAEIGLASARAQLILDVVQAYYDALLSDRLLSIASATLQQAETKLTQTRLARQVGTQPEFELLRAQVTRDNQIPVMIQRQSDREVAYLRLKQLLELPLDQPLELTTTLGDSVGVSSTTLASLTSTPADTSTEGRAPVRQADQAVRVQENTLRIARAQRLPSVAVSSQYGRVAYPVGGAPDWQEFRTNWNIGVSVQLPLFTGGRIRGDEVVARANLDEQRLRAEQTRKLAQLETRTLLADLAAAQASFQASAGTTEQAVRAYQIAEVRYREGISTQTELSDSRILLQQAQANKAMAARNLQVARARVALIHDLPLGVGGSVGGAAQSQQVQQQQQQQRQQQQQQQRQSQTATADGGALLTGAGVP